MAIQIWIPNNPASVLTWGVVDIIPHSMGESESYPCNGYGSSYDIYSVRIYDNSGGQNDATVGETFGSYDDFDYKPYSTTLNIEVDYYSVDAHSATVDLY